MDKFAPYIIIGLLTVLMAVGALWMHSRYEALDSQVAGLVEANKGLAEAASQAKSVTKAQDSSSGNVIGMILKNQQETQKNVQELASAVEKGNTNEKALMSSPLPPDVISVLDATYKDRDEIGTNP